MQKKLLIIGRGRLAFHFKFYFQSLNIDFLSWDRGQSEDSLKALLQQEPLQILLMISDSQIDSFAQQMNLLNSVHELYHFSGALEIPGLIAIHPLMTFGPELYELSTYQKIPLIFTNPKAQVNFLNSEAKRLPNPRWLINPQDKAHYHALCVCSGNLLQWLTLETQKQFRNLGLPENIAAPLALQSLQNIFQNGSEALTGPVQRKDATTVQLNLQALTDSSALQNAYQLFVEQYWPEFNSRVMAQDIEISTEKKI